jgi:5-methyltetrahydropteroyltriglutamate--homocysteine methyltransferase
LWKLAQGLTARPVKFGTIVPDILGTSLGNDFYATPQELLFALADAMRDELDDLANAGCAIIQMEEPNIHLAGVQRGGAPMLPAEFFVETFNRTVQGLRQRTEVWCHTCWGNPAQQRLYPASQSYASALPLLNKLDVDVMTFETSANDGLDLEAIGKTITGKKIAIGVVDHRNLQVETPDQVAATIRKALQFIPVDRLVVTSDCGFGREGMSRRIAFYKMVAIVRGTNIVRKERGLPEAICLAADPRYALADEY